MSELNSIVLFEKKWEENLSHKSVNVEGPAVVSYQMFYVRFRKLDPNGITMRGIYDNQANRHSVHRPIRATTSIIFSMKFPLKKFGRRKNTF